MPKARCLGGCTRLVLTSARKGRCARCLRSLDTDRNALRDPDLRATVFARAGGQCQIRRPGCTGRATELDHIIPLSQGGSTSLDNMAAACRHCNAGKRDR